VLAMILCECCSLYFLRNTLAEHKKQCQLQYENKHNKHQNLNASNANNNNYNNLAHSQQNVNFQNNLLNSINNVNNIKNNNNNKKCPGCNADLPLTASYASKPSLCTRCVPVQNQRLVGAYEAQSFYEKNTHNNNISNFSTSNLANSFSAKTFYGAEVRNYYPENFYNPSSNINNNNNKYIMKPAFPHNPHNNPNNISNNNNNLLNSVSNFSMQHPAYSTLNISNINISQNSRMGNDRYNLDSDRSQLGNNNDYVVSIENFHKHNQSEIKNLLKNKDLEISQIKRDYETKINLIINTNMDQNKMAKKYLDYEEDGPLTINDLRGDVERDNNNNFLNSITEKNGIEFGSGARGNKNNLNNNFNTFNNINVNTESSAAAVDKDMSLVEYSFFKHELEKLEEKNYNNKNKNFKESNTDRIESNNYNKNNNKKNNNYNVSKEFNENDNNNNNLLNDDLDIFDFSDNQGSSYVKNELNPEEHLTFEEKEALKAKKASNRNGRLAKEFFEDFFAEIKKNLCLKEDEISKLSQLQSKYLWLFNENFALKDNTYAYDKAIENLKNEIKNLKFKNDEKISEMKEDKQKELVKIIENNESTILKIKANYENLINLIRKEKDDDIKKLVAKYESDFAQVKSKNESFVEKLKKEYKNQLEIIKKNFEVKDQSLKEKHELSIKSLVGELSENSVKKQDKIFVEAMQAFNAVKLFVTRFSAKAELENKKVFKESEIFNDNEKNYEIKTNDVEAQNKNSNNNIISSSKSHIKEFVFDLNDLLEKQFQAICLLKEKLNENEAMVCEKNIVALQLSKDITSNAIDNQNKNYNKNPHDELDHKEISAKLEKAKEQDVNKNLSQNNIKNNNNNNNESESEKANPNQPAYNLYNTPN